MQKSFDVVALLSCAAMIARKAETYPSETYVIDLAELRQIIFEMQEESEREASWRPRTDDPENKINILMVDDEPGKLLTYEVMLSELGVI